MASGDTLIVFTPLHGEPPASNFATLDTRNNHHVLDFDQTTQEAIFFGGVLPRHYGGGGVTITIIWMADGVTINDVVWATAFERHQDDADDLDSDSFAADSEVTGTAPSVDGETSYDATTHTNGAQMDSLAVGESFRLRVRRDPADAGDDMAADAQLLRVEIRET